MNLFLGGFSLSRSRCCGVLTYGCLDDLNPFQQGLPLHLGVYLQDLSHGWFQEGGDADPRVAWQTSDTAVTVADDLLVEWPQTGATDFETRQQALAAAGVEYILANPQLISVQAELFAPYITTDGT